MTNEILIIASVLLVPGLIGLYASLVGFDRRKTATGCGLVAVLIPVIVAIAIVQGRFVYPVYNVDLKDPSVMQLVASIYYGGEHAVLLLFGVATIVLSRAMRNTPYGKTIVSARPGDRCRRPHRLVPVVDRIWTHVRVGAVVRSLVHRRWSDAGRVALATARDDLSRHDGGLSRGQVATVGATGRYDRAGGPRRAHAS